MLKGSAMEGLLCIKRWGSGVECNFNMMGGGRVIKRFPTIIFFSYRLCQCRHIAKPRKCMCSLFDCSFFTFWVYDLFLQQKIYYIYHLVDWFPQTKKQQSFGLLHLLKLLEQAVTWLTSFGALREICLTLIKSTLRIGNSHLPDTLRKWLITL